MRGRGRKVLGRNTAGLRLRELQARCADNFQLRTDYYDNGFLYEGPWDTGWGRDIDPSNLLAKTGQESLRNYTNTWWFPIKYDGWHLASSNLEWLQNCNDLPDPKPAMRVTLPSDGSKWITMKSYYRWEQPTPPGERHYDSPHRCMWYMLKSYFVRNCDVERLMNWATDKRWMNNWMPDSNDTHGVYLGEFFWAPSYQRYPMESPERTDWIGSSRWCPLPVQLLISTDSYGWESSESDASLEDGISLNLPCKFIVEELGLRIGATEGEWVDKNGSLVACDPCVYTVGPSTLLLEQSALSKLLTDHDLSVFWTLLGEKQIIGGDSSAHIGHLEVNGAYLYRDGRIDGVSKPIFFAAGTWVDPSVEVIGDLN